MQKEQVEKYLSNKYSKNISFTPVYQNEETLEFYVNVLVDGVRNEDEEFIETIKRDVKELNDQMAKV